MENTIFVCVISLVIELVITFFSSFAISRMEFKNEKMRKLIYGFLIMGLSISPFILLFPVYKINVFFGLRGKMALILPYVATSISFNTLLLVGYLKALPTEIDEAAIIDGCNLWDLMVKIILPMTKPVIATIVIFNVLYIWNEFPFASVMLRDASDYTLSMGASFFKGTYTVDYGGIVASSVMIIIPELIFYGFFQKNIVEGMTAGAVKDRTKKERKDMSKVSGLFQDLTTIKKARNGRLASWDQRGKNQDTGRFRQKKYCAWRGRRTGMYYTYLDDIFL